MVFVDICNKANIYIANYQHLSLSTLCSHYISNVQTVDYSYSNKNAKYIYTYNVRNSIASTILSITDLQEIIDLFVLEQACLGNALIIISDAHEYHNINDKVIHKLTSLLDAYKIPSQNVVLLGNGCTRIPSFNHYNDISYCKFNYFEYAVKYAEDNSRIKKAHIQRLSNIINNNIKKRFLCLNRQPKDFRYEIVFNLWRLDILKNTICSLQKYNNEEVCFTQSHTRNLFLSKPFETFTKLLPIIADIDDFLINHWNTFNYEFVMSTGINIITETLVNGGYHSDIFFTEKIFKPILYMMPFIVVGQPYLLYNLNKCGYRTFSSLWSEDYDRETDYTIRKDKICNLLTGLNNLNKRDFSSLLKQTIPITTHNYAHMLKNDNEHMLATYLYCKYENLQRY